MGAYTNAPQIAADFRATDRRLDDRVRDVVRHHTMLLETRIKAAASGRPGPRVITGNYRRSWTSSVRKRAGGAEGVVGTNAPQGRRLEYGFVGPDRIGRVYNQPPYPHAAPAFDATTPGFIEDMRDLAGE